MSTPAPPIPLLTEVVDTRTGSVRASGALTAQGADLLRGTVETLLQLGHRRIVLDLGAVDETDDAGLDQVHQLCREVAAADGRLVVRAAPWGRP